MEIGTLGLTVLAVIAVPLLILLIIAIVLFIRILRMYALVMSPDMPLQGKVAFWLSVVYAVSPADLLPDPIYLDDIGVLVAGLAYISGLAKKYGITRDQSARRSIE